MYNAIKFSVTRSCTQPFVSLSDGQLDRWARLCGTRAWILFGDGRRGAGLEEVTVGGINSAHNHELRQAASVTVGG